MEECKLCEEKVYACKLCKEHYRINQAGNLGSVLRRYKLTNVNLNLKC